MNKDMIYELKKLAGELIDKEHFDDIPALKSRIMQLYDALLLIEFEKTREETDSKRTIEQQNKIEYNKPDPEVETENPIGEAELKELFEPKFDSVVEDMKQKKEFEDTIPIEDTEKLFEAKNPNEKPVSLHDKLLRKRIQVGLNDRIAFVNSLFNFNQAEFNEVLRNLNAFETKHQAVQYIRDQVKPKYNWQGKEELEERFMALIERKFI